MTTYLSNCGRFFFQRRFWNIMLLCVLSFSSLSAKDGYGLWLSYRKVDDTQQLSRYRSQLQTAHVRGESPTLDAVRQELREALPVLLDMPVKWKLSAETASTKLLVSRKDDLNSAERQQMSDLLDSLKPEGFLITMLDNNGSQTLCVIGSEDIGVLYGTFHLLRLLQIGEILDDIQLVENPRVQWRMLNHWDNLNRTVERGYAGLSLWKWDDLPHKVDARYADYARANASIGINAVAINNVNASPQILNANYLQKVAVLADVFRPYGIRVFLSVNFASPRVLSDLETADPLEDAVQQWWKDKAAEIYRLIPNFGGFLVKANSEGQPGPQDYGRTHAEGANMLATALAPHNGLLIWRAFVYESNNKDRVKDAYDEFVPFDGQFLPNVMIQTKNGPLDFQPREPFSPLFGALPQTPQMMEFQITQEYMGFSSHLVYLPVLYKEILDSDTYAEGKGSKVARVIDGTLQNQRPTGIAGVANIGSRNNWTGHPFGQANWYAFGRLAWDHQLSADKLADEWIRMTLTNNHEAVNRIRKIMMTSYEHAVNYQTPLGLTVLSAVGHHYGPQPWRRANFHHADNQGIGYDRSSRGSNAVAQYFPEVAEVFDDLDTCPEGFLAWFHHVPWSYTMKSGNTFWEALCAAYHSGVDGVRKMQHDWELVRDAVDPAIHQEVSNLLVIQEDEAVWWRDACLWYFAQYSNMPVPATYESPRYFEEDFEAKERENRKLKHHSTE